MKVVYAAVFEQGSTNVSQANAFRRLGVDLIEFNYRQEARDAGSALDRDNNLIECVRQERPDILLLSKCNTVDVRVVEAAKEKGVRCILWYMDPVASFDAELSAKVKACDHSFFNIWAAYEMGLTVSPDCSFLQEGFDCDIDKPMGLAYNRDVCFIGNLRRHRGGMVSALNIPVVSDAYGARHAEVVSSTKINLNFTEGGASDRVYKVLAAGGFLLTETWPHMDFRPGVDLDTFTSVEELRDKIAYYLANSEVRNIIAANGYRSVQRFSRDEWATTIIS